MSTDHPFVCPVCRTALGPDLGAGDARCTSCGISIASHDGVAVLVRDREAVDGAIAEAIATGRSDWYRAEQDSVLTGPYRHHVTKRRDYVGGVLHEHGRSTPHPLTILDLGCGDGAHLPWLRDQVTGTIYASDYNLLRLRRATGRGVAERVVLADLTDYPAADDAFDVVFCNHVLEHVPDAGAALTETRRILAPDGIVILGVPNEGAAAWRLAYRLQPASRQSTDHIHFFTAKDLAARCRAAGFGVREVKPLGWGVPHWGLDARVRGAKWVDDALEAVGSRFARSQASSLYLILTKAPATP